MKIYISGPISGKPDYNRAVFNAMAAKLTAEGYTVYNPAQYPFEGAFPLRTAFSAFCRWICEEADAIYLLPGWHFSEGAIAEWALARRLGLEMLGEI